MEMDVRMLLEPAFVLLVGVKVVENDVEFASRNTSTSSASTSSPLQPIL